MTSSDAETDIRPIIIIIIIVKGREMVDVRGSEPVTVGDGSSSFASTGKSG